MSAYAAWELTVAFILLALVFGILLRGL